MSGSRQYASGTSVDEGRSRQEIALELQRIGATRRAFYDDEPERKAVIQFEREGIRYRIELPLPDPHADEYRYTPTGRWERTKRQQQEVYQQAVRERWRALSAYIKALRVGWESGIIKIEVALLPNVVLPDGQTVADYVAPQVAESYRTGQMPALIPGTGPKALPAPEVRLRPADDEEAE